MYLRAMTRLLQTQDPNYPGFYASQQGEWLMRHAAMLPPESLVVEIGSFCGKSTRWLALAGIIAGTRLTCVDPWKGDLGDGDSKAVREEFEGIMEGNSFPIWQMGIHHSFLQEAALWRPIQTMRVTSEAAAKKFKNGEISLLHIDGDHSRCVEDYECFREKMAPHGMIVLDDVPGTTAVYGLRSPESCFHQMVREGWRPVGGMSNGQALVRDVEWWGKRQAEYFNRFGAAAIGHSWQVAYGAGRSVGDTQCLGPSPIYALSQGGAG